MKRRIFLVALQEGRDLENTPEPSHHNLRNEFRVVRGFGMESILRASLSHRSCMVATYRSSAS